MESLLKSVTEIVNNALAAAGDLAGDATDLATGTAKAAMSEYQRAYKAYLAKGMTPEDAADAAERYMRQVYGLTVV